MGFVKLGTMLSMRYTDFNYATWMVLNLLHWNKITSLKLITSPIHKTVIPFLWTALAVQLPSCNTQYYCSHMKLKKWHVSSYQPHIFRYVCNIQWVVTCIFIYIWVSTCPLGLLSSFHQTNMNLVIVSTETRSLNCDNHLKMVCEFICRKLFYSWEEFSLHLQ